MLIDVYTMGTGTNAKPAGYTIAGKTGSTQGNGVDPMAADTDHWYVGYTPDVVVATWVGYDSSKDSIEDAGNRGGASLLRPRWKVSYHILRKQNSKSRQLQRWQLRIVLSIIAMRAGGIRSRMRDKRVQVIGNKLQIRGFKKEKMH